MNSLYTIDPGVKFCAVARFSDSLLADVQHRTAPLVAHENMRVVCEVPQVYDPRKQQGRHKNPQDLIDLAVCAGRMTGTCATEFVTPAQWKGQLPCTCSAKVTMSDCIHHRRMINALTLQELDVLVAAAQQVPAGVRHNMYDAVALGLVVLGRLTPALSRGRKIGQEA